MRSQTKIVSSLLSKLNKSTTIKTFFRATSLHECAHFGTHMLYVAKFVLGLPHNRHRDGDVEKYILRTVKRMPLAILESAIGRKNTNRRDAKQKLTTEKPNLIIIFNCRCNRPFKIWFTMSKNYLLKLLWETGWVHADCELQKTTKTRMAMTTAETRCAAENHGPLFHAYALCHEDGRIHSTWDIAINFRVKTIRLSDLSLEMTLFSGSFPAVVRQYGNNWIVELYLKTSIQ